MSIAKYLRHLRCSVFRAAVMLIELCGILVSGICPTWFACEPILQVRPQAHEGLLRSLPDSPQFSRPRDRERTFGEKGMEHRARVVAGVVMLLMFEPTCDGFEKHSQ